ncbi:MAG: DUF1015 domain-containing protein [Cytophagales bacterium]|nr:DUF1015 domain-containing protein [Armatimonadota bacterium]
MAEIRPFRALRYRSDLDPATVTCPPYDVLSAAERAALADRSPYAAVRVILPEGDGDSRYANAADLLREWGATGVLRPDSEPGLYVTRTEFTEPGTTGLRLARLGVVSLLRLHEYADRVVLPHERTLTGPKEDRLKMQRATGANLESIFGLVDDPGGGLYALLEAATHGQPLTDFTGDDQQRHTLWQVREPQLIAEIGALVAPQPVFIADGHHRYETAVAYAREAGALGTDRPEAFLLVTLSSLADPGLSVLPTHRLVRGVPPDVQHTLFTRLEPYFDLRLSDAEEVESRLRLAVENQPVFGLVLPSGDTYQMTARDASALDGVLPPDLPPALRHLEAVLLQSLVLEKALGIPAAEVAKTDRIAYTRDAEEARRRVRNGEFEMAFLLGRPSVTAIRDVALAGEVMPQKSTFFYPKLLSGLLMRSLVA